MPHWTRCHVLCAGAHFEVCNYFELPMLPATYATSAIVSVIALIFTCWSERRPLPILQLYPISLSAEGDLLESSPSMQRYSTQFLHEMQSLHQRAFFTVECWHAHQEEMRISHDKLGKLHAGSHGDLCTVDVDSVSSALIAMLVALQ